MAAERSEFPVLEGLIDEVEEILRYRKLELVKLLAMLGVVGVLGGVMVADMAAYGWNSRPRGVLWNLTYGLAALIGIDPAPFFAFPVGLFFGFIAVLMRDRYKRFQGVLLLFGALIGLGVLRQRGILPIDFLSPSVLLALGAGAVIGIALPVYPEVTENDPPYRFRYAIYGILAFVFVIVVGGFFEALLVYRSPIVQTGGGFALQIDTAAASVALDRHPQLIPQAISGAVLIFVLGQFLGYESEATALIIGPARSGKTWLAAGLHYSVKQQAENKNSVPPTNENENLNDETRRLEERRFREFRPTEQTLYPMKFEYLHGKLFPQQVTLRVVDHAGEFVKDIDPHENPPTEYDGDLDLSSLEAAFDEADNELSPREARTVLSALVYHAGLVGMVLPVEDFVAVPAADEDIGTGGAKSRSKREYLEKYDELVEYFRDRDRDSDLKKDFILIITKADKTWTVYRDERGKTPDEDLEEFSEYIREDVMDHASMSNLRERPHITRQDPYVTYFKPEDPENPNEGGNLKPDLDSGEHDPLRGASELLERLGRS